MKFIRENKDEVQLIADRKGITVNIAELMELDDQRRDMLQKVDLLRQIRNQHTQKIKLGMTKGRQKEAEETKFEVKKINVQLKDLEHELAETEKLWQRMMYLVPNIVSPDTPIGISDDDNIEIARWGSPPSFGFQALDHIMIGEMHRMIDLPRGVKTAGTRNYYLSGFGAMLHRAVQQLAVDLLLAKGFNLLEVPLFARSETLLNTGFFPLGEDQTYRLEGLDQRLVSTAEVPLVNYYSGEIVDVTTPVKLAAASNCFRSEAGSTGRDVHGLYRVHQFAKVEQVILCEANLNTAGTLLQEITAHAETLLRMLELPYRVVAVCTGDMSQKTYKQFDLETWMPSRQAYGETHSSSNLLDFQARRANIRYRDAEGHLQYCYTLNNTAVASPRILIPLLENHQQEDGTIHVPTALRPYLHGLERMVPGSSPHNLPL